MFIKNSHVKNTRHVPKYILEINIQRVHVKNPDYLLKHEKITSNMNVV